MDLHIYIPTKGRPDSQITWDNLKGLQKYTSLVIPKSELKQHKKYNRKIITHNVDGIGSTRQFIVDYALKHKQEKIVMLDDDLIFSIRSDPSKWNLRPVFGKELLMVFTRFSKLLNNYAHATISPRFMNNVHYPLTQKEITPQRAVHGIKPEILKHHNIRYDHIELMEDHFVTLSLFTKGYPNCMITDAAWDQKGVSNADGGCSSYRSAKLQEKVSNKLKKSFPNFVSVVKKKTKTGWDGIGERTDVRIQWRKAYNSGTSI
jgi:hypothetical protein